jgi:hypothetical protein
MRQTISGVLAAFAVVIASGACDGMRMVRLLLRAGLRQSMRGVSGLRFSGTGLQLFGL